MYTMRPAAATTTLLVFLLLLDGAPLSYVRATRAIGEACLADEDCGASGKCVCAGVGKTDEVVEETGETSGAALNLGVASLLFGGSSRASGAALCAAAFMWHLVPAHAAAETCVCAASEAPPSSVTLTPSPSAGAVGNSSEGALEASTNPTTSILEEDLLPLYH